MEATLDPTLPTALPASIRLRWTGRVLSGLPVVFLAFDAAMKLARVQPVAEASARLGLPEHVNGGLGVVLLTLLVLYLIPRTAVLGAVLITGYLGGAVAMHLRVGDPLASHTLFPVYVGTMVWAGLFLRDARVRALVGTSR
jgi:hypothetical protein